VTGAELDEEGGEASDGFGFGDSLQVFSTLRFYLKAAGGSTFQAKRLSEAGEPLVNLPGIVSFKAEDTAYRMLSSRSYYSTDSRQHNVMFA
jgi:hypothetical protein